MINRSRGIDDACSASVSQTPNAGSTIERDDRFRKAGTSSGRSARSALAIRMSSSPARSNRSAKGKGEECAGCEEAVAVPNTCERLVREQGAVVQSADRLMEQRDRAGRECGFEALPPLPGGGNPLCEGRVAVCGQQVRAAGARALCRAQGEVRGREERSRCRWRGIEARARVDLGWRLDRTEDIRCGNGAVDHLRDDAGFLQRHARQEHAEVGPRPPGDDGAPRQSHVFDPAGDKAQQFVCTVATGAVIDRTERT